METECSTNEPSRVKTALHRTHEALARGLRYQLRALVALGRSCCLFARGVAPFVVVLVALHYFSHAYVAVERDVSRYVVETAEAKVDETAEWLGYERPAPKLRELNVREIVERESLRRKLNPRLALANMLEESGENPHAYSSVGAIGLMQVMPFNAKRCGLKSPAELLDPEKNIACGVRILAEELATYRDDPDAALQAYNGGAKCVNRCPESINHAKKVLRRLARDIG